MSKAPSLREQMDVIAEKVAELQAEKIWLPTYGKSYHRLRMMETDCGRKPYSGRVAHSPLFAEHEGYKPCVRCFGADFRAEELHSE